MRSLGISIARCYIKMPQTNLIWKKSGFQLPAWLVGRQPFVNPDSINNQKVTYLHIVCSNNWKNFLQWSRSRTFAQQENFCWALSAAATWVSSFQEVSECWIPQQELMIAWTFKRWYNGLQAQYRWTFDQKLQCFFNCGIYVSKCKEQAKFLVFYQRQDLHLCWLWGPCMLHIAFLYRFI